MTNNNNDTTFYAKAVQFVRPNGRQQKGGFDLNVRCKEAYDEMEKRGLRLEAEVIPGNEVYVSISDSEQDHDNLVEHNGPNLTHHVENMLLRWYSQVISREEREKWERDNDRG